jgi:transketolase
LGEGTLDEFKTELPDRFFMEGISEAYLIGMAAGLAMEGKIPYVNTIATFLTRRCFEQIAVDLALQQARVRLIANGGGLVYAPLGPTHLAIEDIAILRSLPNMTIVAPADADEMRRLIPLTLEYPGPMYIRLAKGFDPIVSKDELGFEIGRAIQLRKGGDALIITTGVTLGLSLEAAEMLEIAGIGTGVLHLHTIKPLDSDAVLESISRARAVVAVEEHTVVGGLGSAVAELIAEAGFERPPAFRRLGIPDMFPDEYGSQATLMKRFSLTAADVVATLTELLSRRPLSY